MVFGLLILKMSGILSNDRMKLNDEDLDIGKYNKSNWCFKVIVMEQTFLFHFDCFFFKYPIP